MRRRGSRLRLSNGNILNVTEEAYIADTTAKWGVSLSGWSTRFSTDRTKFFIGNSLSEPNNSILCPTTNINDWTLGTSGIVKQMRSIHISTDGTKVFGEIFSIGQWTLSTPFDLSTTTYNGAFAIPNYCYGVFINPEGTKMVLAIANGGLKLIEYALATANIITSGVTEVRNVTLSFNPDGIVYYNSGNNLIIGQGNGTFYKCSVTNPYTLEGFVLGDIIMTAADISNTSGGGLHSIEINETAKKLYIIGGSRIWQFSYTNL